MIETEIVRARLEQFIINLLKIPKGVFIVLGSQFIMAYGVVIHKFPMEFFWIASMIIWGLIFVFYRQNRHD